MRPNLIFQTASYMLILLCIVRFNFLRG